MKISIINQNLFYLETKVHIYNMFLLINSKIIETTRLIIFSPYYYKLNEFNMKILFSSCNISLNVLYGVAKEYYKINILDKPFSSNDIPYKPFFYKKRI
jgi:hypothetical protein